MTTSYWDVLKHPVVARLTLIQFISYFGTWFSQVAIASMMLEYGASELAIAYIFMMLMLPAIVLAPISGWIIDKVSFKKLMSILLIIEIIMTLLFMTINSLEDINALMLFVFIRSAASSILFAAEMALFPKILQGEMLKKTNELHSIVWSVCFAAGMALGGLVTYYFGYDTTFLIDVILYSIAFILLLGLQLSLEPIKHTESALKMMKSGFIYLKNHKKLIHLILLHASIGFTSFETLITLLADLHYKYIVAIPLAIGWINATRALAMTIGPLLFSKYINDKNLHYIFTLQGLAIISWSFVQHHYMFSIMGIFIVGLLSTSLWSYTYYMLQKEIEVKYLGRVIAYNDMIFMLFNISITLFVGYAAKMGMELKYISIIMGCGFISTAIYYKWFKKHYLSDLDNKSV
ncbi:MAG: FIG00732228: membrane protein [uncultured Sulfurovum sp.]|uniref:FIG00732228: membrane protein n=1 Tax=uncultured Sulfurovum sp. TaxID=269237 RepID=A0A6S6U364_9BACT|nr:MAG: FIG00732228: membrane protein [uncultured Sulfurovum sp.]